MRSTRAGRGVRSAIKRSRGALLRDSKESFFLKVNICV